MIFEFDIETSSHDLLKEGCTAGSFFGTAGRTFQRVVVSVTEEDCITESGFRRDPALVASEIAIQIGFCFGYVTACFHRI